MTKKIDKVKESESQGKYPFWRQGDVGVLKIPAIPANAKKIKHNGVLAYGEVTGHKHQLVGGRVKFFRTDEDPNRLYFRVESRFTSLNHGKGSVPTAKYEKDLTEKLEQQERAGEDALFTFDNEEGHFTHKLPEGDYQLIQQQEFDWTQEMVQRVED